MNRKDYSIPLWYDKLCKVHDQIINLNKVVDGTQVTIDKCRVYANERTQLSLKRRRHHHDA